MKIAQIVASLESRHGGPSRSVRGLAAGFGANGHDVELLGTSPGAGDGCPMYFVNSWALGWSRDM